MNTDDWTDLPTLRRESWRALAPRPGAPLVVLATIGRDGAPQTRTLMLRRADPTTGEVDLFTDALTPKVAELAADPRAALHLYDATPRLQVRLSGVIEAIPGDDAIWAAQSDEARGNYGVTPAPGTKIATHESYRRAQECRDRFVILRMRVDQLEAVLLSRPTHRRALFQRKYEWRGDWLAP